MEDAAIEDRPGGGYSVSFVGEFKSFKAALKAIKRRSKEENFYPAIYYVNDHGNVELLDDEGDVLKSWV